MHLVIDAGSTGTRFCLFAIERDAHGDCRAPHSGSIDAPELVPATVPARNGLADLDAAAALAVVAEGLARIPTATAARITGAALLGTGGFRRQSPASQTAMLDALRAQFAVGAGASVRLDRIEVLSGEMEGVLAWRAARELGAHEPFAILEIGGSTVQYADPAGSTSAPIGLTAATGALVRAGRAADCRVDDDRGPSFARCRAAIAAGPTAGGGALKPPAGDADSSGAPPRLYGLGAPWAAAFAIAGRDRLGAAELAALGEQRCPLGAGEMRALIGERWSPRLVCLLLAYQSVLLESLGAADISRTGESWPRGAAVSGEIFPTCAASAPRR